MDLSGVHESNVVRGNRVAVDDIDWPRGIKPVV